LKKFKKPIVEEKKNYIFLKFEHGRIYRFIKNI